MDCEEMFLGMICPGCGRRCGNGGRGVSVRCQCGWSGGLTGKDAELLAEFYRRHLERNQRILDERKKNDDQNS